MQLITYLPITLAVAAFALRFWLGRGASKLVDVVIAAPVNTSRPAQRMVRENAHPARGHFVIA